jgi:hypothetical protein
MEKKQQGGKKKLSRLDLAAEILSYVSGFAIMGYGLFISRAHITHIGHWLGLPGYQAETLFIFIDFVAVYGKLLTFTRHARRYGFWVMIFGFAMSTACNVGSGLIDGAWGVAGYGLFLVVVILVVETGVSMIRGRRPKRRRQKKRAEQTAQPRMTPAAQRIAASSKTRTRRPRKAPVAPKIDDIAPKSPVVGPAAPAAPVNGTYAGAQA